MEMQWRGQGQEGVLAKRRGNRVLVTGRRKGKRSGWNQREGGEESEGSHNRTFLVARAVPRRSKTQTR